MKNYDVAVIGAGPAGLSAAIYLARFRINTLIIDAERGRSTLPGVYSNVAGFTEPVGRREYRKLGAEQALKYGGNKVCDEVYDIKRLEDSTFEIICGDDTYYSHYIIFCMGVHDNWPEIPGAETFIGSSIHSCPICAGYETIDKTVLCIGFDDRVTALAICMLIYTDKVILATNGMPANIEQRHLDKIKRAGIPLYLNKITNLYGENGKLNGVRFDDGRELLVDYIFSTLGVNINSQLAQNIGVNVEKCGYIIVDEHQKTNVDRVFAAGDVTNFDHKQIVTALYEGFMAAYAIYSDILKDKIGNI